MLTAEPGHKFLHHQLRNGAAIGAKQQGFTVAAAQHRNLQAFTAGAAGGGLAGLRLIRTNSRFVVKAAGLLGVQFEGAAAVGANMVEAALGLAGINDFAAAALWAADDLLKTLHTGILAITGRVFTVWYAPPCAVLDSRSEPANMAHILGVWSPPRVPSGRRKLLFQ